MRRHAASHGGCHGEDSGGVTVDAPRIALVGSPNTGKTTLFNALTGLHQKTGNYPGVTVSRAEGVVETPRGRVVLEDLPGSYSLDPISPDEKVVTDVLDPDNHELPAPDGVLVMLDSTALRRSLGLLSQVLQMGLPTTAVVSFTDELARRGGSCDVEALQRALGIPVVAVVSGGSGRTRLLELLDEPSSWATPPLPPPLEPEESAAWAASIAAAAGYRSPETDARTRAIDAVLLHPVWGTLTFAAVMFLFFQIIFTVAAPLQGWVEEAFAWLGAVAGEHIGNEWVRSFVADAVIGGVGGVLVFVPQIALLFVMVSFLESVGYLSRAAFLMDRLMSRVGLEGRAFVALLSSFACAIPGIMATRTLPSSRDRIATMMVAPLMTCSARLPVYVLLIGMLVPAGASVGPFGLQGVAMFGLYLLGAVSAMAVAWVFQKVTGRDEPLLPFYMEIPPYRVPSLRNMARAVWDACAHFVRKAATVILATAVILWLLLNLPIQGAAQMEAAGVDTADEAAVAVYTLDNSAAASVGRALEPVFEPLGFDWRINVGVLSSLAAREVFVATMGQIASASDPENPQASLEQMTVTEPDGSVRPLFDAPTIAALLVFFVYAMQCMATLAVMRRETGGWKWPVIAFVYMFALAWTMGFLAHTVVGLLV